MVILDTSCCLLDCWGGATFLTLYLFHFSRTGIQILFPPSIAYNLLQIIRKGMFLFPEPYRRQCKSILIWQQLAEGKEMPLWNLNNSLPIVMLMVMAEKYL